MRTKKLLNPDFIVALMVAVFASLVLTTAYSYSGISGTFPQLVGWVFLGLALLEIVVQIRGAMIGSTPNADEPDSADITPVLVPVLKEVKGFLWLGVLLVVLYLLGFMISTPLYVFAFLRFSGARSIAMSAAIAAGATIFVYLVFVQFLEYRLFPGVLLG